MTEEHHYYLQQIAYNFWLSENKPNGEEFVETMFGQIKIKDIHWMKAQLMADFDAEIFRELTMIQSILEETNEKTTSVHL